jgi:hypothetical protein
MSHVSPQEGRPHRTLVLLNANKEQITNSNPGSHPELQDLFSQDLNTPMPQEITWQGRRFVFMDAPEHATDHANHELYRFIEKAG